MKLKVAVSLMLLVGGCAGSADGGEVESSSSVANPQAAEVQTFAMTLGDQGGTGCPADPSEGPCELSFSILDIEQNTQCRNALRPLKPNEQFLRFDLQVDATQVETFSLDDATTSLLLPHWSIDNAEGGTAGGLYLYLECGSGTAAIAKPIVPGMSTSTSAVVAAPKGAHTLRLSAPSAVWEWPVP